MNYWKKQLLLMVCLSGIATVSAEVTLEQEVKITDSALHFDGVKVKRGTPDNKEGKYDYYFGPQISAHGDSVKPFGDYVFLTWYHGGKDNRHVMLTRYNTLTGSLATIKFPHRHTGWQGIRHIGESHNTIAVAISPIDGTIHLLYDMHGYDRIRPGDGSFANDYFRYSYSVPGAATLPDSEFTLDKFVKDTSAKSEGNDDYKHLSLTGVEDHEQYSRLTYPKFFTNTDGTLLMYMRKGRDNNGGYVFSRYEADNKTWSPFIRFNVTDASNYGQPYDWGLYGNMKYVNGKLRVGFQRRLANKEDKYSHQNGFYYAYSDHPDGRDQWKTHEGKPLPVFPVQDADTIKVGEPGDLVEASGKNQVSITGGFDWNVTARGDIHIVGKVKDKLNNQTVNVHSYKPAGAKKFTTTKDFSGADKIYTAGNDIYIVGLKDGRPFIEKGIGGTNNFALVYHAQSGKTFNHGTVHIANGKVYFYMMEKKSGSSQPLYLQIIDLGIGGGSAASNMVADN
ncbi:BNR-4 repeat-containing protein [Alteromonas aestuariivivens]|nr:BNR-4 repeat-containing protein [Alteromonas aestuariivivens]